MQTGSKMGDATVFGFPGRTEQYLTSDAVEHVITRLNPMRIAMRDEGLAVINAARASSDALRIAYAAKQKQRGQRLEEVERPKSRTHRAPSLGQEARPRSAPQSRRRSTVVEELTALNESFFPFLEARSLFIELAYYGPDVLNYAHGFAGLIEGRSRAKSAMRFSTRAEERSQVSCKDYDAAVDEQLLGRLIENLSHVDAGGWHPQALKAKWPKPEAEPPRPRNSLTRVHLTTRSRCKSSLIRQSQGLVQARQGPGLRVD